jgi:hypothetical protein
MTDIEKDPPVLEMDTLPLMLMRLFQRHIEAQCLGLLHGAQLMQAALNIDPQTPNRAQLMDQFWHGAQSVVIGAGNVSKALWGTGRTAEERERRYKTRQVLRDSLQVTDESPFRSVKIRNDYEHFDERLEDWWEKSTHHNYVGEMIGPAGQITGDAFNEDLDILRWFNNQTGDLIFWGNELHVPTIVQETNRILPIARTEAHKSHYVPPPKKPGGG